MQNIKIKLMKNGGPWNPVYDNVRALVMFFLAYLSIGWREEFYMRYNSKVEQAKPDVCMCVDSGPPLAMHS